ncbi:hypothetical protein [Amycolatopsis sp. NPDC059657]|uniref:hypothetical protein n=1 Tax=Amycolatopsis sp. NPDC059657 TaxID=3346899 RepID=UPI00366DE825
MVERRLPAPPLSALVVTREYIGDPDLHLYWRQEINDRSLLFLIPVCESAALHPTPHDRSRISAEHHNAQYLHKACWLALEADRIAREMAIEDAAALYAHLSGDLGGVFGVR